MSLTKVHTTFVFKDKHGIELSFLTQKRTKNKDIPYDLNNNTLITQTRLSL